LTVAVPCAHALLAHHASRHLVARTARKRIVHRLPWVGTGGFAHDRRSGRRNRDGFYGRRLGGQCSRNRSRGSRSCIGPLRGFRSGVNPGGWGYENRDLGQDGRGGHARRRRLRHRRRIRGCWRCSCCDRCIARRRVWVGLGRLTGLGCCAKVLRDICAREKNDRKSGDGKRPARSRSGLVCRCRVRGLRLNCGATQSFRGRSPRPEQA
jgi:hypothetical protein